MTYKANRKLFLKDNLKTIFWGTFFYILTFVLSPPSGEIGYEIAMYFIQLLVPLTIIFDLFWNPKSVILPSFKIVDGYISTGKFNRIKISEIDYEKSKINRKEISLVHSIDSWKNKVIINPKLYSEDIENLIRNNH